MTSSGEDTSRAGAVWGVIALMALMASGLQALVLVGPAPWSAAPWSAALATMPALVVGGLLLVGFLVAETWAVHVRTGRETVTLTLSDVPLVVALFFLGPLAVIGLRIAGAAPVLVARSRTNPRKLAFNLVWFWLEACSAVIVWQLVVGPDHELRPLVWLAAGATTVVLDLLGTLLISLVMAADAGVRPGLREVFSESNPLVALVNAAAALLVVHVAVADWRALWTVAVVVAVLAFAQQSHNRQRRRSDSIEQLGRFTGALGDQLDVSSAAITALTWMTHQLRAEVVELVLPAGFAGEERGWRVTYDGTVTEVRGRGLSAVLTEELAAGPVLVRRTERGRYLSQRLREAGLRDAMAMHLLGDGDRIGTLVVGQRLSAVETFQRSDLDELLALGNHLSVTLRNARRADLIREHAQEELRRSLVDDLTGLSNRRALEQDVAALLVDGHDGAAVVVLDLDRFTDVNDTLGHAAGDQMLGLVAERLLQLAPEGSTVARLHADHFAVLLRGGDAGAVDHVVTSVRAAFATPFSLGSLAVGVSARLGLAVAEPAAPRVDLLRQAVIAVAAASSRRTELEVFSATMEVGSPARLTLLTELRRAILVGELRVHLQPQVRVSDGEPTGAEALVRWQHPRHGLLAPDEFVPLAENSGLITSLTSAVLEQSLAECARWRRSGRELGVAVNISPRSLLDDGFVIEVARLLRVAGVPATALTLEITESSLMADPDRAVVALESLRALGVRLSVDDLGTGYSSLSYLHRLPVTEVKIDRSFLRPHGTTPDLGAVVGGIVDLGHRLGYDVVAEGVEDEATFRRLQELGCDLAQGFWIGRPMSPELFAEWLEERSPTTVPALRVVG